MDNRRAKAIVTSPDMVNVTYNSKPVYMERVNDADSTCTIHYLDQPGKKAIVPLSGLTEQ